MNKPMSKILDKDTGTELFPSFVNQSTILTLIKYRKSINNCCAESRDGCSIEPDKKGKCAMTFLDVSRNREVVRNLCELNVIN